MIKQQESKRNIRQRRTAVGFDNTSTMAGPRWINVESRLWRVGRHPQSCLHGIVNVHDARRSVVGHDVVDCYWVAAVRLIVARRRIGLPRPVWRVGRLGERRMRRRRQGCRQLCLGRRCCGGRWGSTGPNVLLLDMRSLACARGSRTCASGARGAICRYAHR